MSYLVPVDTKEILEANRAIGDRNLFLEFNKFIYEWQWDDSSNNYKLGNEKKNILKKLSGGNYPSADKTLEYQVKRNKTAIDEFKKYGNEVGKVENLETQWRLAVGVGSSGPLETGMTLHHLYGYPYIPATSVKGIARAAAYLLDEYLCGLRLRIFNNYIEKLETKEFMLHGEIEKLKEVLTYEEKNEKGKIEKRLPTEDEYKIIKDNFCQLENIRCIFGSQSSVGAITFFDGLPDKFPKLDVDVLSPHYGKYYMKDGIYREDRMQPVPSFFLTVAPNTKFVFSFYASCNPKRYKGFGLLPKNVIEMTKTWLVEGLKQLGIGGKTSSGYGYFEDPLEREGIKPPKQNFEITSKQLKKDEAIAEIISLDKKPYKVKIENIEGVFACSGLNPIGLKLNIGSKIIVSLNIEQKNKKIISCKYSRG